MNEFEDFKPLTRVPVKYENVMVPSWKRTKGELDVVTKTRYSVVQLLRTEKKTLFRGLNELALDRELRIRSLELFTEVHRANASRKVTKEILEHNLEHWIKAYSCCEAVMAIVDLCFAGPYPDEEMIEKWMVELDHVKSLIADQRDAIISKLTKL